MAEEKKEIENTYNCGLKIWNKFSDKEKEIYNSIRSHKQDMINPKGDIAASTFETISHNFACLAAWEFRFPTKK